MRRKREHWANMSSIISPLAGFGLTTIAIMAYGTEAASAASPAYCALYAREYAHQFTEPATPHSGATQRLQDEAYYRCLNMDEEPALPATSAYFGADFEDGLPGGGSFPTVSEGDASEEEIVAPAEDPPPVVAKRKRTAANSAPRRRGRGSGFDPWTPEWIDWCTAHYRSFNPETGYVLTYASERKLCP